MSWSDPTRRGLLAALGPLLLAGCFRPMLAQDGAAGGLRGRIALPAIDGRDGYYLTRRLEERLGAGSAPQWRLEVAYETRDRGIAIAQDNTVTRRMVTATARWRLVPKGGGKPLMVRTDTARSGYNATGSLYATGQAAQAIERRLAEELAERIAREILARADRIEAGEPIPDRPDPEAADTASAAPPAGQP